MVSKELLEQFEDAEVEYDPQVGDTNNEEFWNGANKYPETIEYEIVSMYRLREKEKAVSILDQLNDGKQKEKKESKEAATTTKEKPEYLTYDYNVHYTNTDTRERVTRDFHDGGLRIDATFKEVRDDHGEYFETILDKYVQTYTLPFSIDNVKDILDNQIVEYPDPDNEDNARILRKKKENKTRDLTKLKMKKRKCPVINQERIHYYIGIVSDMAYHMTDSKYDIRIKNGLDWLNLSYDELIQKHKEQEREALASRTVTLGRSKIYQ
jgi:hypothetical protein